MKILVDIPQDFEIHFNRDRFKDSLKRIKADLNENFVLAGNYERELLDMLIVAFEEAEAIHSTCILKGTPVYNYKMNCDDIWNEAYDKRDGVK